MAQWSRLVASLTAQQKRILNLGNHILLDFLNPGGDTAERKEEDAEDEQKEKIQKLPNIRKTMKVNG
jgi:hypothetical protein